MLVEAEGLCLSKAKDQWLRLHQHRQGSQRAFQEKREAQVPQAPRAPREGGQTLVSWQLAESCYHSSTFSPEVLFQTKILFQKQAHNIFSNISLQHY